MDTSISTLRLALFGKTNYLLQKKIVRWDSTILVLVVNKLGGGYGTWVGANKLYPQIEEQGRKQSYL